MKQEWSSETIDSMIDHIERLEKERDQLAARCDRLCAFVKYRKGKMPVEAHQEACDLLEEQPSASLARHDAKLLRSVADELDKEMDGDLGETIDDWDHGYGAGYMRAVDRITRKADKLEREQCQE